MGTRNEKIDKACKRLQASVPVIDGFQKVIADLQNYARQENKGQVKRIILDELKQRHEKVVGEMAVMMGSVQVIVNELGIEEELVSEFRRREMEKARAEEAKRRAQVIEESPPEDMSPDDAKKLDETVRANIDKNDGGTGEKIASTGTVNADEVPGDSTPTGDGDTADGDGDGEGEGDFE